MIQTMDERLDQWVRAALDKEKVEVSWSLPAKETTKRVVHLHLLDVRPTPALRTPKRPPLQLTLRYLVAAAAADVHEAHRLLGELAFAALDETEFEVETEPLPAE